MEEVSSVYLSFALFQISDAKQLAQNSKDQARDLQDRIDTIIGSFEREKNETKELIHRVKQFLMGQCSYLLSVTITKENVINTKFFLLNRLSV